VRDLHLWIVGEFLAELDRHLLRTELLPQLGLDDVAQPPIRGELGRLGRDATRSARSCERLGR
jgi:hypothetical protein